MTDPRKTPPPATIQHNGKTRYYDAATRTYRLAAQFQSMPENAPKATERYVSRQPNKTESTYRAQVIDRMRCVWGVKYEGLTFRMANGHKYTPDWIVVLDSGRVECHECKGPYRLGSHQRARLAFDQARVEFPWADWVWAVKDGGTWRVERFEGRLA